TRTGPDVAPGIAGDQVLEVRGERRRAGDGTVDVLVPENGAAHLHAGCVAVLFVHCPLVLLGLRRRVEETLLIGRDVGQPAPPKCSSSSAPTSPGRSTLARCAALGTTSRRAGPETPSTMVRACSTGVAGSSAPAIARTGARTWPSTGRRSMVAMASQQAA